MCYSNSFKDLSLKTSRYPKTKYQKFSKQKNLGKNVAIHFKCGMCYACTSRMRNDWFVRLHYHSMDNVPTYHVILSYSDWQNRQIDLDYKDVQLYHKRLRKNTGQKFTYFASLEYGKTGKPHYHIIYFDLDLFDLKIIERRKNLHHIYQSPTIHSNWKHGVSRVQKIQGDRNMLIRYLIKYTTKRLHFVKMKRIFIDEITSPKYQKIRKEINEINEKIEMAKNLVSHYPFVQIAQLEYRKITLQQTQEYKEMQQIKAEFHQRKERVISSQAIGYASMLFRIDDIIYDGCVYISGRQYNLPLSWVQKLYNTQNRQDIKMFCETQFNSIEFKDMQQIKLDANAKRNKQNIYLKKDIETLDKDNLI